jgi:hypothetical protein
MIIENVNRKLWDPEGVVSNTFNYFSINILNVVGETPTTRN